MINSPKFVQNKLTTIEKAYPINRGVKGFKLSALLMAGFLLSACGGGGGSASNGDGGSQTENSVVGSDTQQKNQATTYGSKVTINGDNFINADSAEICSWRGSPGVIDPLNTYRSNSEPGKTLRDSGCSYDVNAGFNAYRPRSAGWGFHEQNTGTNQFYPERDDTAGTFSFQISQVRSENSGELFSRGECAPQKTFSVYGIKYSNTNLYSFMGFNQYQPYTVELGDFDFLGAFISVETFSCYSRTVHPTFDFLPGKLVTGQGLTDWTLNSDVFQLITSERPIFQFPDVRQSYPLPVATKYILFEDFEMNVKPLPPSRDFAFSRENRRGLDMGFDFRFSYFDQNGVFQEVEGSYAGPGLNDGWRDVSKLLETDLPVYLTRTDREVTAIKLDGDESFMCSWADCPDGVTCGTKVRGSYNPTTSIVTFDIPDNTGNTNPIDFEIASSQSTVNVLLNGNTFGEYSVVSGIGDALANDMQGYCSHVEQ